MNNQSMNNIMGLYSGHETYLSPGVYLLWMVTTLKLLIELVSSEFAFCWLITTSIAIHSPFPQMNHDTSDHVMFTQKTFIVYASNPKREEENIYSKE